MGFISSMCNYLNAKSTEKSYMHARMVETANLHNEYNFIAMHLQTVLNNLKKDYLDDLYTFNQLCDGLGQSIYGKIYYYFIPLNRSLSKEEAGSLARSITRGLGEQFQCPEYYKFVKISVIGNVVTLENRCR